MQNFTLGQKEKHYEQTFIKRLAYRTALNKAETSIRAESQSSLEDVLIYL